MTGAGGLAVPDGLARSCRRDPARQAWLARLPQVVRDLAGRWSLTLGPPFADAEGSCAWVARVTRGDGSAAVLKIGLPHFEGRDEIAGLRFWDGHGTVRLLAADAESDAMLLEACAPGTPLRALPEAEQDAVLGEILPRIWERSSAMSDETVAAAFRPLSEMLAHWAAETRAREGAWRDAGLVRAGLALFDELPATADRRVVLFTDLHAGNVLRAQRAPWLAIDPKPFVGDPAYDATQHLFNCPGRMRAAPGATIDAFADRLGLSRERVRLWTFARAAAEPRDDRDSSPWLEIARAIGA